MRIAITVILAAAVAALAVTADAAPARKKQVAATKVKGKMPSAWQEQFGFGNSPDHYPVGSNEWWRAMDREGRGGCCGTPN